MQTTMSESSGEPDPSSKDKGSILWGASWEKRKRMLRIEAWILLNSIYLLIAFAYVWPQDFRNADPLVVGVSWSATIIRTFIFHIGLVVLAVAIVAGIARSWLILVAAVPLLLVTVGPAASSYLPTFGIQPTGATLNVMSVNLLFINKETDAIISEIESETPDVLLIQEYTQHWHEALEAGIGDVFPHRCSVPREDSFGAAIYSRIPFVVTPQPRVPLGQATEPQIRAVVEFEGTSIALYNVHLLPPWGMEYTIEHRAQFADMLDILEAEQLPTIVGGDFNFTENSPNATALGRLGFTDAHDQAGWGRGATWPVNSFFRWIPSIRLDHIFISNNFSSITCKTGRGSGSDHRPVVTSLTIRSR